MTIFLIVCALLVIAIVGAVLAITTPDREQQVLDEIDRPTHMKQRESVVAAAFGKPRIK